MKFFEQYQKPFLIILAIAIFLAIVLVLSEMPVTEKIIWGVKIGNVDLGGLGLKDAEEKIDGVFRDFENSEFIIMVEGENISIKATPADLGIKMDREGTLKRALTVGRQRNIFIGGFSRVIWFSATNKIEPSFTMNEEQFNNFFKKNLGGLENPAQNATLIYDKKNKILEEIPAKSGIIADKEKLGRDIFRKISLLEIGSITVLMANDFPQVEDNEVEKAKARAQKIIDEAPFTLKSDEKEFVLAKDDVADFLDFRPIDGDLSGNKILGVRINEDNLRDYLVGLTPGVALEPRDAKFEIKDGKVIAFALSQPGRNLNIAKNIEGISRGILTGEKTISLVFDAVPPKITESEIETLGIDRLIGSGASNFAGSPKNRMHNIKVGANKFQGILIKPEEEFSFNQNLGEIGPSQGYLEELVIKKNKTIPEFGGGLCQVSTTLFRAAINAGFKITERFPHAFPVRYYNPQGFDATIYPPHPDLRFVNNTSGYVLLQAKIDGSKLTFEIYGQDDGRRVAIEGPFEYDKKSDGSMKTKLVQKVYDKDGGLTLNQTFYSNYKSPALYPVERNPLE